MTGLQKQVVPVNFGGGIDTKTDSKLVVPGKVLLLENAVFKKRNRYDKRNGNRKIPNVAVDGTAIASPDGLAVFNDELLEYAGQRLYSYSSGAGKWVDKGPVVSAIVRSSSVIRNTATQTQVDSATVNGVTVYAWEDSRGGVRASVFDEANGTSLLSDVSLDASASRPRCLAFGSFLYVFYYKSGSLYVRRINPLEPTAFDAAVTVSSTVNTTSPTYDVYAYGTNRILWAHNVQGSTAILAGWLDDTPAVLTGILGAVTISIGVGATNSLAIVLGPANTFYLAWHNTTNGVRCTILNNGLGTLHAPFTVEAITTANVVNITGYKSTAGVTLLYEVAAAAAGDQYIRKAAVASDATVGTPADFLRSVGLWSKAWTYTDEHGTANTYVAVVHSSALQATYFVARSDGLLIAKQQATLAGGLTSRPVLANVWSATAGTYSYALLTKTRLVSENAHIFTPTGVTKTTLDFTNQEIFTAAQLGDNLHIVGGFLSMYDGLSVVEHGFHLYPESVTKKSSATTGGTIPKGLYQFVALYEWTDNYGQVHRSAPSVPVDVDISGSGTDTNTITMTVDTLRLTAKKGTRTNASVVLYMTEAGPGPVFYRVTSVTSPTFNDATADTLDITVTSGTIISNEILYTVGGELDNMAPPSCSSIAVYKNRIFLGGLEDENDSWFSKERKSKLPVEFSDQLLKTVEPIGGGLAALYVLDDKLLYFKRDRYYYTYGEGPNNAGQLGDFAEPQFVTADVGCVNASSIVRVPDGIMLETAKGLYTINSQLQPSYTGDEVEDFNSLTITSAVLDSDNNQVRFTTSDGPALVYDYYAKQWSVFTNFEAYDAVLWKGAYVLLKTNGAIWKEEPGYFKDDGAPIRVAIVTGWLSLATVVGYQRIYKYALLGEYKSPHLLKVSVGYDHSVAYTDSEVFDPETDMGVTTFGDGATFGADAVYGGENIAYRYVASLKTQKCTAIRFRIEELTTAATAGSQEAFNITTLGLLAGIKSGMGKLKSSQNLGMG